MIRWRSMPSTCAAIDTLKPGISSVVMQAPPILSLRSRTSVLSPFLAR